MNQTGDSSLISRIQSEITSNPWIIILFVSFFAMHLLWGVLIPRSYEFGSDSYRSYLSFIPMRQIGGDFIANYEAANVLRTGGNIYKLELFVYPPLIAYLVTAVSGFPFLTAYRIWLGLNLVLLLISFAFIARLTKTPVMAYLFLLACYFHSYFLLFYLERGQFDIIPLFFLAACFYFYRFSDNEALCALFFSLAALVKIYPAIFGLYFLAKKRWKIIGWAITWSAAIILITDWRLWVEYLQVLGKFSGLNRTYFWDGNHSFASLLRIFKQMRTVYIGTILILTILCISVLSWLLYKGGHTSMLLIELSAISLLMTLIPHTSHDYNLTTLGFVYASIFSLWDESREISLKAMRPVWIYLALLVIVIADHVYPAVSLWLDIFPFNRYPSLFFPLRGIKMLSLIGLFIMNCISLYQNQDCTI